MFTEWSKTDVGILVIALVFIARTVYEIASSGALRVPATVKVIEEQVSRLIEFFERVDHNGAPVWQVKQELYESFDEIKYSMKVWTGKLDRLIELTEKNQDELVEIRRSADRGRTR